MVDALRRAREWVTADGIVIDVHPTATPARLDVDGQALGRLDAGDAAERHARASAAIASAIAAGWFTESATVDFTFGTSADSLEELRDHIAAHWRSTRIGADLFARAQSVLDAKPSAGRPRVVEEVVLTILRVRVPSHDGRSDGV
jgi:hypothetical protein